MQFRRALLKQRGIPFSERMVVSNEDGEALERITGARDAPTLTIGTQTLRGLSSDAWNSYLDAAGYPRNSVLPANYQYRPATPVVDAARPPPPMPVHRRRWRPRRPRWRRPPPPAASGSGVRF